MKRDLGTKGGALPPKDGPYQERFKDGSLACSGEHRGGLRVGEWKWYRENGELMQTGSFDREVKTGVWRRYHANGRLWDEGAFENGKPVGEWKTYDESGQLVSTKLHRKR